MISLCLALLLAAPQALAYSKLQKGAKGVEVLAMQDALKKLGFSITADGKYGDATVKAVKAFQKQYGLTVDGVAGNKTLTLLNDLIAEGKRIGNNINQIAHSVHLFGYDDPVLRDNLDKALGELSEWKYEILEKAGKAIGDTETHQF